MSGSCDIQDNASCGCHHGSGDGTSPRWRTALVAASGTLTAAGLLCQWSDAAAWLSDMLFFIAALAGGALVFPEAWGSIRHRKLDMNVLMTVAVTGAWLIGEHAEAASVIFLFALSELLESFSVGRARRAIQSLLKLAPETALKKMPDGSHADVPVGEVQPGDSILVRNGQRVPLDGTVLSGTSAVNQAPITGESMPVEKKADDTVFAGSINGEGSLEVRVTKATGDTMLARIIHLVEEAQEQKAPTQRFVDRFAEIYTPAIFVLAVLVALLPPLLFGGAWGDWTYRALVLLVIACPCALVIATPVSIVSGLTAMARRGVLIKGGAFLEAVGKLRALALDKTGTITEGRPRVVEILPLGSQDEDDVLSRAAAIDFHSQHPLARAVMEAATEKKLNITAALNYESRTARGAVGEVDGHPHFVGNHRFTHELGVCTPELEAMLSRQEESARSVVVVGHMPHQGCAGEVLGVIAVADTVRREAVAAMRELQRVGLQKIVMLSGDNQRTADTIANLAGVQEAHGDMLPDQKVEYLRAMVSRYQHVGMIGDGVNDAPALAVASVGIAMGAAGSDTAIETADMALMRDDLRAVADAIMLGRRTLRIIQFNVAFALAVKAVFLILAFTGHTSLWLAILADTGATLLVIANALRLLRP